MRTTPRNVNGAADQGVFESAEILARLERLPISPWHRKMRTIIGTATFFDSFDAFSIAFVLPVLIGAWHLSTVQAGWLISAGFLGQMIGAISLGHLAERIGRIPAATTAVSIFTLTSIACAFSQGFASLLVLRLIQGVGLGGEVPVAATYIGELSRTKTRGRFVMLYEMIFAAGLVVAAMVGRWAVPALGWRSMFLIGGLPGLVVIALVYRLPESPRWLLGRGRFQQADAAVSYIEGEINKRGMKLPPPAPVDASVVLAPGSWGDLFRGIYRRRTVIVWIIWSSLGFLNYGLSTWLPTIYQRVYHLPLEQALNYSLASSVVGLLGALICAFAIDRIGRRGWFTLAFAATGIPLAVLGLMARPTAQMVFILASISFLFVSSLSQAIYLYTPEIYPTRLRAAGCGAASAWLRIASMVAPPLVGWSLSGNHLDSIFLLFGGLGLAVAVVARLGTVETSKRVLEDVSP